MESQRSARRLESGVKPWKLHEFTLADLDGNMFRVFYDFSWETSTA